MSSITKNGGPRDEESGLTPRQEQKLRLKAIRGLWGGENNGDAAMELIPKAIKNAQNNRELILLARILAQIGMHQDEMWVKEQKLELEERRLMMDEDRNGIIRKRFDMETGEVQDIGKLASPRDIVDAVDSTIPMIKKA